MEKRKLIPLYLCLVAGVAPADSREKPSDESLRQQIVAKETQGLEDLKSGDLKEFADSTSDEVVFVDAHGPASKAEVVEHTAQFRLTEYSMDDVRFVRISADSGLIVYTLTGKGASHGKEFAAKVYVSSLWGKRAGKWVCLFGQETGAK